MLASAEGAPRVGVVIVVGGPQYRVGSHRQFALLARALAAAGTPCLRFDYRGMGDSDGPRVTFEEIASDIRAAIDALLQRQPSVQRVVLWGLCDGASAIAFYAASDPRVAGLALFNPWVRTQQGEARTVLTHYYARRLIDPGFWRKLVAGKVSLRESASSLGESVRRAAGDAGSRTAAASLAVAAARGRGACGVRGTGAPRAVRQRCGGGGVQVERGGQGRSRSARSRVTRVALDEADHTFSCAAWRDDVAARTVQWLRDAVPDAAVR